MKTGRQKTMDRRQFLGGIAAATTFTILPRRVLGGANHVPPSERLNIAQIGCGTQGIRQVDTGLITRDDIQITCVCDPNRDSTGYVDWSRYGNRNRIRELLNDRSWGENDDGIRGGREVAREIIERYYGRATRSGDYRGVRAYADFRELLDNESDLDAAVVITPDHTHATIALRCLEKGVAPIVHKPVSNMVDEVRKVVRTARNSATPSHLLAWADRESSYRLEAWLSAGVIGPVREVHNWTARPYWPQGWLDYFDESPPVPDGFEWDLWLGPEPHRPYHPHYTHALYRGWYRYGGGSFADMANYSLWPVYRILDLGVPTEIEGRPNGVPYLTEENVSRHRVSQVAFPLAGSIHFRHAARDSGPPIDVFWYEGGIKPQTPPEMLDVGEELASEGLMFVGENGRIVAGFRGEDPRLLPESRRADAEEVEPGNVETVDSDDEWIQAVRTGTKSRGRFESIAPLAEATALAAIAYRFPGRRLLWDAEDTTFTNESEANALLRRDYRPGWEL